ncbi:phage tail protein [Hymenobacter busanensis]|uniref:Phage tail protein n=1 Tax=Hymenobacter busanensis TaxID=2607656 RepID=A0A7L4ZYQ0_9BACT|nr:tail fiber protein [Hymenobacter busanensis]KAA9333346.1 phage tail protein [Hymenobacter busanensis]QHJ07975.1 phage tail protein [Hymenobacter busanensis]
MENYLGEIRMFAGNFAPQGWFLCQGQLLAISEYDALFNLLGTTYGGDGMTTFALPNMQSRVIVGQGQGAGLSFYPQGATGGTENVTLLSPQMPAHNHVGKATIKALKGGTSIADPTNALPAASANDAYSPTPGTTATMGAGEVTGTAAPVGGSQPHNNIQPVTAINYIIAWSGVYPSQD